MSKTIRLATEHDAAGILAIYAPVVRDSPTSFELAPPTVDQIQQRIAQTVEQFPWIVFEQRSALLGYAYAIPFRQRPAYRWVAESTVYVRQDAHRQGIGRRLYSALFACLKLQGQLRVIGGITLPNAASVALHERMGFRHAGTFEHVGFKFGQWHDVGFWSLQLAPETPTPAEPVPLPQLLGTPELQAALTAHHTGG